MSLRSLSLFAFALAFAVVGLGAFVRLSESGLGCPDWPGCYGQLTPPQTAAVAGFDRPVVAHKAFNEMLHRYFAGGLSLLIFAIFIVALKKRLKDKAHPIALPAFLLVLVIFQALLGMWTVTLKLHPLIVVAHLLGGFATLGGLWLLTLKLSPTLKPVRSSFFKWARWGIVILSLQIILGGLTSAHYAAIACPDFPQCRGTWLPELEFENLLETWTHIDADHEYGLINDASRVTVHFLHRVGALVTFVWLMGLGLSLTRFSRIPSLRRVGTSICLLVSIQAALGISTVLLIRPLPVAVLHNLTASLLLLALIRLNFLVLNPQSRA